jgi:hypothetical protein
MAKASELPARKDAPKKTGKAGPRPLDPEKDFDKPTKKADSPAAKGSLLAEQPKKPKVVKDRFEVFYVGPVFSRTAKKRFVLLSFRITAPIEDEHIDVLPQLIGDRYKDALKKGCTGMSLDGIAPQRAEFYLAADMAEPALVLAACKVLAAKLAVIQRKGEGSARRVVRLDFRLQVKLSEAAAHFAEQNLQNSLWLKLADTQHELWDDGGK